jgi:hypothetical protein
MKNILYILIALLFTGCVLCGCHKKDNPQPTVTLTYYYCELPNIGYVDTIYLTTNSVQGNIAGHFQLYYNATNTSSNTFQIRRIVNNFIDKGNIEKSGNELILSHWVYNNWGDTTALQAYDQVRYKK